MKANMRQNIIPNPKQTKKHHLSIQDNGEMETDESSQEEGNDMTLEMNDLTLEGVHFNKEKVLLAIAYHISPEKVAPRFGPRIEEYKNKFERSDNNCVMLGILADIANDIPTFYDLLLIFDQYKEDWFEGDWLENDRYIEADLQNSESFVYELADTACTDVYGSGINDYMEQFTDFYRFLQQNGQKLNAEQTPSVESEGKSGIHLNAIEFQIVSWFQKDNTLHPLREIKKYFSQYAASEVQQALDRLQEMGIVYGGETMINNLYGLTTDELILEPFTANSAPNGIDPGKTESANDKNACEEKEYIDNSKYHKEATSFYRKINRRFREYTDDWESFADQAPTTVRSLVQSGITPVFSPSRGYNSVNLSLSFRTNTDPAKQYLDSLPDIITSKGHRFETTIREIDAKLEYFRSVGYFGDDFTKIVSLLGKWIRYTNTMGIYFREVNKTIYPKMPKEIGKLASKWRKLVKTEGRESEAEKLGVSVENLDKHKAYIDAKGKKEKASTSTAMRRAEKAFTALKGYLDAADLAKECSEAAVRFKEEEDEAARLEALREREIEERKAENLRRAVELYKEECKAIFDRRVAWITDEAERLNKSHKETLDQLDKEHEDRLKKCRESIDRGTVAQATLEKDLAATSIFAVGRKKQLRKEIDSLSENNQKLHAEESDLERKYHEAREREIASFEAAKRKLQEAAAQNYPYPKDPRDDA